jgi:protein phosphatase 4 regulatory subunit 3
VLLDAHHGINLSTAVLVPAQSLQVVTRVMTSGTPSIKLRATDILLSSLAHDPLPLRSFLASTPGHRLLGCLVDEFVGSGGQAAGQAAAGGLPEQIAELLKMLVDPGALAHVHTSNHAHVTMSPCLLTH